MSQSSYKITLQTSDKETFEIEKSIAVESVTLKNMIDDECADTVIPVSKVTSPILAKVIEYMKKHSEANANNSDVKNYGNDIETDEALKTFDKEFVNVDHNTLFDLIEAANYLEVKLLLDLTCQTVADMMKGKTPEQIRETFHIVNDYTKEEEEEVRRENAWAFE